ncbi:Predicted dehydrogenase [Formosa sp. Hel1_31_208]|uniref:Gfo/Idh/MocA family protein n=1 Tax=Formosa sp. Hel1_31_208 TaxID=1798225 RepID=UPI00087A0344|nr:Gfo/Idh/MocA family oxidoreductase [Formosa sp. Hel1_31_208]SDS15619.1 Predicted dehydrogenase [Formosa sp. Hel1_31_208]
MDTSKPKTINWGIIGLGKIAHKFAQDLNAIENVQLYAVASRNQDIATDFANRYNAKRAYGDYNSLALDPNIDAVYIATPHVFHKANSILCLNQKKAVLCEKPFAMNGNEVEDMITAAQTNNVLLMEALWTYFLPHYQFVLKQVREKTFGEIQKLEVDFGFKPEMDMASRLFNKSLGGGSLLDIGIYPIFAALSTLGEPIKIESTATFLENGIDTSCQMLFTYKHGTTAQLKSTLMEQIPTEAIFYCDKGIIKINSYFNEPSNVTLIEDGKTTTFDFDNTTNGFSFEIVHFNELIRQQKTESDIMTFDFSRKLMHLLDTVRSQIGLNYE